MIAFSETPIPEFGPQLPTKEQVVSMFKNPDILGQDAVDSYNVWFQDKQRECDENHTQTSKLKFNIEVAELLFEANMTSEAYEYISDAWDIVDSESKAYGLADLSESFIMQYEKLIEINNKIHDGLL